MFQKIKDNLKKHFFLKFFIPLFAVVMLVITGIGLAKIPQRKITPPLGKIGESAYKANVVGSGVTEPKSETINIGVEFSGIVSKIFVTAQDNVKKGDKLFALDDKEARANYILSKAQYKTAQVQAQDSGQQFSMYKKINDKRAISKDDYERKKYAAELDRKRVKESKAQMEINRITLEKLTIRAPIDGQVLKVNVHPGEYAAANSSGTLMTIGDLSKMYVRVEIDETEAYKVNPAKPAIGSLRGRPEIKIPLKFVRFEPAIVPKGNITGDSTEKVDTRVLQVLYGFDNNENVLVGQQMDVYIESDY